MQRPEVLFFDAGGTILHLDLDFFGQVCAAYGVSLTERSLLEAEYEAKAEIDRGLQAGEISTDADRTAIYFSLILRRIGIADLMLEECTGTVRQRHEKLNLWSRSLDGTMELLERLRDIGYRLAVISNSDGRVHDLLRHVGIADLFEIVIDSAVVGIEKPDPAIFHMACDRVGVHAEQGLYVGDIYQIDVVGARAAGMPALLVDPLDQWSEADCPRIGTVLELEGYLKKSFPAPDASTPGSL